MKTVAITAGCNAHRQWAAWLAERMNLHASVFTDVVPCIDISDDVPWGKIGPPYMVKLHIWEYVDSSVERVMWIDADCYVTRSIYSHELPTFPVSAVSIAKGKRVLRRKDGPVICRLKNFFNGGVLVCTREGKRVWDQALGMHGAAEIVMHRCRDETLLNWRAYENFKHLNGVGWHDMGTDWNNQSCHQLPTENTVIIHFDGEENRDGILSDLYQGRKTFVDVKRPRAVKVGRPCFVL